MTPGDRPGELFASVLGFWALIALGLSGVAIWAAIGIAIARAITGLFS